MLRLTYVGHATLLIELDGHRFLTDPLLTPWLGPLRRQWPPVDLALARDLDAVLLSHIHHDHLHLPSLARVDKQTQLIVPTGSGSLLPAQQLREINEVEPGDRFSFGSVEVEVVRADHDATRPFSAVTAVPQGFILRGSQTIYFAGDTDIFPEMSDLDSAIDLALIPIWGWGPTLGTGHLNPFRAADALTLLEPRIAVPIHWGTYFPLALPWRRQVALRLAPLEFRQHAEERAPEVEVRIIKPGDATVILPGSGT